MFFYKTPFLLRLLYSRLLWKVKTDQKKIYLTFDDGPIPDVTGFVLQQLQQYKAKATFFCVGENIEKYPKIFSQLIDEGHTVGNHCFNHLNGWKNDDDVYVKSIQKCDYLIRQLDDRQALKQLFRPPYGRIKRSQIHQLKDQYTIVMWDVLSGDFMRHKAKEECLRKAIRYTSRGTIIVFHDSLKAEEKLKFILPRYLQFFHKKGYEFAAL